MKAATLVILVATAATDGQLIIGGAPGGALWNIDPANPALAAPIPGTTGASPWGMTYDPATNSVYWIVSGGASYVVHRAAFNVAGMSPVAFGGGILPEGGSFLGMAFDSTSNRLYSALRADQHTSIYEISTSTGAPTFIATLPTDVHFTGFDYDPLGNRFLGSSGFSDIAPTGLYELNFLTGTPGYTFLAPYPASEFEIEGLAIGNGRAYLVNSDGPILVVNLATGLYEPMLASPLQGSQFGMAGAAWVPAPATAMALLAVPLIGRRRRER